MVATMMARPQMLALEPPPQVASVKAVSDSVRQQLGLNEVKTESVGPALDPALEAVADKFVTDLLNFSVEDSDGRRDRIEAIEELGTKQSAEATRTNGLLQQPLRKLGQNGLGGGDIAKQLGDLKVEFDAVDPTRFNFEAGWAGRWFGWLPFVGKPLNVYFTKFESAGTVIEALFKSLGLSKEQIIRDNDSLLDCQTEMRLATVNLRKVIQIAQVVDAKLEKSAQAHADGSDMKKFINEELLFPLRQRIGDLQQQLVVNQQGIIAFEVLIRTNKELIRGVDRCVNVTRPALQIGVTAAMALANQRIVIGKIEALDTMAGNMIEFNAKLLRDQGVKVHKQAASAKLSNSQLAGAVKMAIEALDDIAKFRNDAVVEMGKQIADRQNLIGQASEAITRMERGNKVQANMRLDVEAALAGVEIPANATA